MICTAMIKYDIIYYGIPVCPEKDAGDLKNFQHLFILDHYHICH